MTVLWQIFNSEVECETKTDNINVLLGYPNPETKTTSYRKNIKHPTQDLWRGCVEDELTNACAEMTPEERLDYYNSSDLENKQWLIDNGWFEE